MGRIRDSRPKKREGLEPTARDKTVIRAAHEFRLVTTDDLEKLTESRSRDKFNKRLKDLWGNEYLDRPEKAQQLFDYKDKRHTVHALGQEGANWLAANDGVYFPKRKSWATVNRDLKGGDFIEHTLGVSRTMIQGIVETRDIDGVSIIRRKALWETSKHYSPKVKNPHSLPTVLNWPNGKEYERNTTPDYPFVILDQRTERTRRGLSFLEYDRATEDYTRSSPYRSSILQKDIGYADIFARSLHTDRYGLKVFRRLFVTEGDDTHLGNVMQVYRNHVAHIVPATAFLYTTVARVGANGWFGAETWLDGNGAFTSLLPAISPHQSRSPVQVPASALAR